MNSSRVFIALFLLTLTYAASAQIESVLGYGKHVIDPATKAKSALYTFKVTATQKGQGAYSFHLGSAPEEAQFHDKTIYKDVFKKSSPIVIGSPSGWKSELYPMMEANQYSIGWGYGGQLAAGQSSDLFTVKLPKADPAYVSAYYTGSETIPPPHPLRRVTPFDTTPPKFDFTVITYSCGRNAASARAGWTEVVVTPTITDNYDPYPVTLLSAVTSTDTSFAKTDVDGALGDEVLSFWVKNAPNRQYTIKYTGMDASGNKTEVSKNIWAP